jgi:AraC family transcriptional regulator, chitin signaling transcriptional activator
LKKLSLYLILFLSVNLVISAQFIPEKGVPLLENFTPQQYKNKGKIWDIKTAPNGMVYMAADKGLMEYDGKTWNNFKGSKGFTRSVLVVNDSLIYTGSDLDFGVWKKNRLQGFDYSSLYPFQKDVQEISEEFWDIHQQNDDILFVSSRNIYLYKNRQLVKIPAPSGFTSNFRLNDSLYFADKEQGLYVFDDFSLQKVFEYPGNTQLEIIGMYENANGLIIVSRNNGLYQFVSGKLSRFENALSENLKIAKVFDFEQIGKNHVAFGTVLKGLYIADSDGKILHHVNRHKGLPSNTVLSLHYSQAGQLWLGMDYGISSLNLENNLSYFFDYRGDFGTGYTALLKDDEFYLGTNQGLYQSKWEGLNNNLEFFRVQIVPETEGQVWTLEIIDNTIFMGHDKGLYVVNENRVEKLGGQEGVWAILPYKNYLLTGNYNGISIFHKAGNKWTFLKKMDLILGSCNQLILENDNILWVNIPHFGVIRAVLDSDLNPSERIIFPENNFEGHDAYLLKNDSGIHIMTDKFQYAFNITNKEFTHVSRSMMPARVEGLLPGIYKSVRLNSSYEFYPVFNGFALKYLRNNNVEKQKKHSLTFRKIEAFKNQEKRLIYPGAKVPFHFNNFRIECIVPNQKNVLYQYKLNDETEWSNWMPENTFDFLGLSPGEHEIRVCASVQGKMTGEQSVLLYISPPWYHTWYAYIFYILLILSIIYFIRARHRKVLRKQQHNLLLKEQNALREQAEKHKQEIQRLEQERLQSEYDQLKQQLKNKTIELASKARDNEEKNRLILALKETCEKAQNNPSISKMKLAEMHRILDSYLNVEDKTFEIQMDELHQDFFKKLKEQFPGLSGNDLRWCAYLKIGLNSKEIADILNIQPSSSYISRSRLRKKLNLDPDEDLYTFLNTKI